MAKKAYKKFMQAQRSRGSDPMRAHKTRVKAATKMLTKQFDIGQKKAAKLANLFIQAPKAMGSGRPGERYYT